MSAVTLEKNYFDQYKEIRDESLLVKLRSFNKLINFFENAHQAWLEENKPLAIKILDKIALTCIEDRLPYRQVAKVAALANTNFIFNPVTAEFIDGTKIVCNKFILLTRSAYFRSMFSSNMKEAHGNTLTVQCDSHALAFTKLVFQRFEPANFITEEQSQKELQASINAFVHSKPASEMNEEEIQRVLSFLRDLLQKNIHEWDLPWLMKQLGNEAEKYIEKLQEYNFINALAAAFEFQVYVKQLMENASDHFSDKASFSSYENGSEVSILIIDLSDEVLEEYKAILSVIPETTRLDLCIQTGVASEVVFNRNNNASLTLYSLDDNFFIKFVTVFSSLPNSLPLELSISCDEATSATIEKALEFYPNLKALKVDINELSDLHWIEKCTCESLTLETQYIHDKKLSYFPERLQELSINPKNVEFELPDFPPSLKKLHISFWQSQTLPKLPDNLVVLELIKCEELIVMPLIPENLKRLKIVYCIKLAHLPYSLANVEHLILEWNNNLERLPKSLPHNLKSFELTGSIKVTELPSLPESLEELVIRRNAVADHLPNRPASLKKITLLNN